MTAPSMVLLGYGSHDPRVAQVSHELRNGILEIRPDLDISIAFLDGYQPDGMHAVQKLVRRGVSEVVLVPLLLSDAFQAHAGVPALVAQLHASFPQVRLLASRPIGPEAQLLGVIDRRLRDALRDRRVTELDALVFSAAGSPDVRSNAIVSRRARQWSTHHKLPCVTAFASASGPTTAEAIRTLRAQGRRHIAVGSWFLSHSLPYSRQAELALESGAVAVAEPLGAQAEIGEIALHRYVVAAMELVDVDTPIALEEYEDLEPAPVRHLSSVG